MILSKHFKFYFLSYCLFSDSFGQSFSSLWISFLTSDVLHRTLLIIIHLKLKAIQMESSMFTIHFSSVVIFCRGIGFLINVLNIKKIFLSIDNRFFPHTFCTYNSYICLYYIKTYTRALPLMRFLKKYPLLLYTAVMMIDFLSLVNRLSL